VFSIGFHAINNYFNEGRTPLGSASETNTPSVLLTTVSQKTTLLAFILFFVFVFVFLFCFFLCVCFFLNYFKSYLSLYACLSLSFVRSPVSLSVTCGFFLSFIFSVNNCFPMYHCLPDLVLANKHLRFYRSVNSTDF
jgi:hypothetical protein